MVTSCSIYLVKKIPTAVNVLNQVDLATIINEAQPLCRLLNFDDEVGIIHFLFLGVFNSEFLAPGFR